MLDSIFVGMSGLMGYSRGLRVIANNTANINTPGFKGAALQFGNLFYANDSGPGAMSGSGKNSLGQGLTTYATSMDFSQGELRSSGNDLDLAVDGQGLFILKDASGTLQYTRDGAFKFDDDGYLVGRSTGAKVVAHDQHGALVEVSLAGLRTNPALQTSSVAFMGTLYRTTDHTGSFSLSSVTVRDTSGAEHVLTVKFEESTTSLPDEVEWKVTVLDGERVVATTELVFDIAGNVKDASNAKVTVNYAPQEGATTLPIVLDFSKDVQCYYGTPATSTIRATKIDGHAHGELNGVSFDEAGTLKLSYSNGQSADGAKLALARFDSPDNVRSVGDNFFAPVDSSTWQTGTAKVGAFGSIKAGVVELSNVDLSSEFSELVIMQRGYQASSQVVSTANEMLQELFSLKGR